MVLLGWGTWCSVSVVLPLVSLWWWLVRGWGCGSCFLLGVGAASCWGWLSLCGGICRRPVVVAAIAPCWAGMIFRGGSGRRHAAGVAGAPWWVWLAPRCQSVAAWLEWHASIPIVVVAGVADVVLAGAVLVSGQRGGGACDRARRPVCKLYEKEMAGRRVWCPRRVQWQGGRGVG